MLLKTPFNYCLIFVPTFRYFLAPLELPLAKFTAIRKATDVKINSILSTCIFRALRRVSCDIQCSGLSSFIPVYFFFFFIIWVICSLCTLLYSQTSIYVLNWPKMVVLIAKSTQIEVWIPIDMWSGLIGQWPSQKKLQKFDKPLELHVKGFNWSITFPKKFQNFLKT